MDKKLDDHEDRMEKVADRIDELADDVTIEDTQHETLRENIRHVAKELAYSGLKKGAIGNSYTDTIAGASVLGAAEMLVTEVRTDEIVDSVEVTGRTLNQRISDWFRDTSSHTRYSYWAMMAKREGLEAASLGDGNEDKEDKE